MSDHDREWIIGCIKHDGFIKTDRFDKANHIILDALEKNIDAEIARLSRPTDLISRADAIEAVASRDSTDGHTLRFMGREITDILSALPSAEPTEDYSDLPDIPRAYYEKIVGNMAHEINMLKEQLESADAVQGWRIGKPTEQGEYMVTLDSFGHKYIDLFYYGKPMMPNRKVRGKCWYRSDDEWGDVVYNDTDILAWQPLPKPYKGGDDE